MSKSLVSPRNRHSTHELKRATADDISALYRDLKLAIEYVPIESLNAYKNNARTHSREQVNAIEASIRAFGFIAPVMIDQDQTVIGGHGALLASKQAGYSSVPVVRLSHLSEGQKKALRIALNRLPELAGWNRKLLALEFNSLLEIDTKLTLDFGLTITGFSAPEIDQILEEAKDDPSDEDLVPERDTSEAPVSRIGDIWICNEHRLINGDARDPASYAALLGEERASVGLHDSPYNVSVTKHVSKSGRHGEFVMGVGEWTEEEFTAFLTEFLRLAAAHSRPGAVTWAFMDWRHIREMLNAGHAAGLRYINLAVWDKGVGAMGSLLRSQHELCFMFADPRGPVINNVQLGRFGRTRTNVWSWPGAASLRKELELHPTPKPVGLLAEAIRDVSHRGDIVLDSFCGSGSTMIAAAKTGRRGPRDRA
jgi:DNA modification methylase